MRTILKTMAIAYVAIAITACALLAPLGKDNEARRVAKITLAAYETTQQAILIYGRLPTCDHEAEVIRLCKDRELWGKIKAVEKAAATAIAEATPVLNGTRIDAGELVAALAAIENVKAAIRDAHAKLVGSPRVPPQSN